MAVYIQVHPDVWNQMKERIAELERELTKNHKLIEAGIYDDIATSYAMDGDPLYDEYTEMANELRREVEAEENNNGQETENRKSLTK